MSGQKTIKAGDNKSIFSCAFLDLALHSAKICNGESRTLSCKPGQRIKVNNAFYGKKNGQDCHGALPYKDESPTCSALDAKYNVQRYCEGRRFCLVHADDATYGRSLCPNINKYLQLTYFCEDPPASEARSSVDTPQVDYEEDAVTRSKINSEGNFLQLENSIDITGTWPSFLNWEAFLAVMEEI